MKRFFKVCAALALSVATSMSHAATTPAFVVEGYGTIARVIDGDTFDIRAESTASVSKLMNQAPRSAYQYVKGHVFRVRLASVDTAESVHPDAKRNSERGVLAKNAVARATDESLIHFRCYDFGKYGRAICNLEVQNSDHEFDLGEALIRSGYSRYERRWGDNPFMHERYMAADKKYQLGR